MTTSDHYHDEVIGGRTKSTSAPLYHISLDELQNLPDGANFYASFSPTSAAFKYVMGPELRDYVIHRSHFVNGSWAGDLTCSGLHNLDNIEQSEPHSVCPNCHHLNENHPQCQSFSWLTVLCGGRHVKL